MEADLERLARRVKERRMSLPGSPTQAELCAIADVSLMTWGNVERGTRVIPRSLAKVSTALGWTADSCQRILDGMDPIEVDRPSRNGDPALAERISRLETQVAKIAIALDAVSGKLEQMQRG